MTRLDKYLGAAGFSRSEARSAIARGRAAIDGRVEADAAAKVPEGARVALDGVVIGQPGHVHLMMNKPPGVITAGSDARHRTVFDLLDARERHLPGLCAVGRLDRDTTGLLLFTTDGQLAHRLISPRFTVEKVYLARVDGALDEAHVRAMAEGIKLKDFTAQPARLRIIESDLGELTVTEGKYHQVKRMFAALGREVIALNRASLGGVVLDAALAPGAVRALTGGEAALLYAITRLEEPS